MVVVLVPVEEPLLDVSAAELLMDGVVVVLVPVVEPTLEVST